jgi:hypothetical protein
MRFVIAFVGGFRIEPDACRLKIKLLFTYVLYHELRKLGESPGPEEALRWDWVVTARFIPERKLLRSAVTIMANVLDFCLCI